MFPLARQRELYLSVDARTAIEKARSNFTFDVRDLDYVLEAGLAHTLRTGRTVSLFAAQEGKEAVDASGRPCAWLVGGGLSSPAPSGDSPGRAIEWSVSGAAVVGRREAEGDLLLRGEIHWSRPFGRFGVGADAYTELLVAGTNGWSNLRIGPRLDAFLPGRHRASLFARFLRDRIPLETPISGWAVGLEYGEGEGYPATAEPAPDIRGIAAAGAAGGRQAGRLRLLFVSPELVWRGRLALDVDANIVTAADARDLYYLVTLGAEREVRALVAGIYAYHRSNHELARPNDRVTSINVLEAGLESAGWSRSLLAPRTARLGRLDFTLRAGVLVQSSFSPTGRAHAGGGVRWSIPIPAGRAAAFLSAEAEEGQIGRRVYAAGVQLSSGIDLRVEVRRDDQYFSRDKTALLAMAGLWF